jgi:hypothetical protein
MNKTFLIIVIAFVIFAMAAVPVAATMPAKCPLPPGKPYDSIWTLLQDLQKQINTLTTKVNTIPAGQACWDLNNNGKCDLASENKNGDHKCDINDCKGAKGDTGATGATGPQGPAGSGGGLKNTYCPNGEFVTGFDTNGALVCSGVCGTGKAFCNGNCIDVSSDPNNCGACGNVCSAPQVQSYGCQNGQCTISQCSATMHWLDCDGQFANGCETDKYLSDNCGVCGNVCPAGSQCFMGTCSSI